MKQVSKLCSRDRARAASGHRQSCCRRSCSGSGGHRWSCGGTAAIAVGHENAKSERAVGGAIVTWGGELQNCQSRQQFLKMHKSLVTLCTNGHDFLGDFFERTFANKHSVFGDQTSSSLSAVHSDVAGVCLSAVMPQTGLSGSKQMQTDSVEE